MSEQLFNQAISVLDHAKQWGTLTTDADYSLAGQFIVDAKRLISKIKDAHKPSIQTTHEAHKAAIALCDSHISPILAALRIVEPLALAYKQAKDREAREETAHIAREKEAKILSAAEYLDEMGYAEEAYSMLEEVAAPTRSVPQISTLPKIQGLSTRKRWTFTIVDPAAVKRSFCMPNESFIKATVENAFYKVSQVTPEMRRALQDEIGGIEVFETETIVGRTK